MTTYTIVIDEAQRALIELALNTLNPAVIHAAKIDGVDCDELDTLATMLEELPADEAANPGVIHGLCV